MEESESRDASAVMQFKGLLWLLKAQELIFSTKQGYSES